MTIGNFFDLIVEAAQACYTWIDSISWYGIKLTGIMFYVFIGGLVFRFFIFPAAGLGRIGSFRFGSGSSDPVKPRSESEWLASKDPGYQDKINFQRRD